MKDLLLYIWQLPQNILGLVVQCFYKKHRIGDYYGTKVYWLKNFGSAVCLGKYILIDVRFNHPRIVSHEYGHHCQSLMLGWLYLIVVGLPSVTQLKIGSWLKSLGYPKMSDNYYNRFPENWADRLGGVEREAK